MSLDLEVWRKICRDGKWQRPAFCHERQIDVIDGARCVSYTNDAATVLQNQTRETLQRGEIGQGMSLKRLTHSMNGNIVNLDWKAAELHIQTSTERDVCRKLLNLHGEKFMIWALQVYSDKSQTSLGGNSFLLYPSQVTILNFSEEWRRAHITKVDTIVDYLLVREDTQTRRLGHVSAESEESTKVPRFFILHALHNRTEKRMK